MKGLMVKPVARSPNVGMLKLFLGLFVTVLVLEMGLRFGSFVTHLFFEHRNLQSIRQKGTYRVMCLGECTTLGQYPRFLEKILNSSNKGIRFKVIDRGMIAKTADILSRLQVNIDKYQPDMVIVMMGINEPGGRSSGGVLSTPKTILLFRSLKIYKLAMSLGSHIMAKSEGKQFRQGIASSKVSDSNLNNDSVNKDLVQIRKEQEEFAAEERIYKDAIERNPDNYSAYMRLGWFYKDQGKLSEAERIYNKGIELNPSSDFAYMQLGFLYKDQGKFPQAERFFNKIVELNPYNYPAYVELGWLYSKQGEYTRAQQIYKYAIELDSNRDPAYMQLSWLYKEQGEFSKSEQVLKDAIERNPGNDIFYRGLAEIYNEVGNYKLSNIYSGKVINLGIEYCSTAAKDNYRELKHILDERNIKLVCVQYPMRNIEPLKRIFKEQAGDMVFVDNERVFKDAVKKEGFKKYFNDMFAGDFGHCTDKGNMLLAETISIAILLEVANN